ncbi:MAG: mycofactocin precursor MftA [Pseudoclavibacter sp.]
MNSLIQQNNVSETPAISVEESTENLVETESLVEEVSIDGMCGVY